MKQIYFLCLLFLLPLRQVQAQVAVTATGGTTGPTAYTTLKGAFDAINAGTHQGTVNISITGNTTETGTASLNASGNGAASYTAVTIKPGAGASPTISGSISSGPLIRLNGSRNVTIDGSNTSGGTSRNLTVSNTSATSSNVLVIGSTGTTPITNVTVKNSILINGTNTSTAVLAGDAATVGSPGYFNNLTLQNNSIQRSYIGYYLYATVAAGNGNNTVVTGNDINAAGANAVRLVGIYAQGLSGLTISNNNIGNFETTSAEFDRAIWLATATTNATISGNTIADMAYTGTSSYAPIGINVSSGVSNANVTVSGNTVRNLTSSGTGTTMGMFVYSSLTGVTIQSNRVSSVKNTNTSGYGAAGIILAPTVNNAATKVRNNFVWDVTGYGFNGYASGDNGNGIVIDGGGGIDIDFNTVVLNTEQTLTGAHRASCLLITANVTAANTIALRNNILANLQTVGNASSRLALSNAGPSNVFSAINYNNYYTTSTNLSSTGTNASITNTLAQLQTSLGGNANSSVVQPVFLGAADLHLSPANPGLSNTGSPVSGITTDIDGDTRSTTAPDMGADEFSPCPVTAITTQPTNAAVCAGNDTSFTVASSNGTLFQWQVNTGAGFTNITNNAVYSGATTATLSLNDVPASYAGYTYRCVVNFFTGCTPTNSNAATLSINAPPVALITPAGATAICPGGNVALNANSGAFTYQWQSNGSNITSATGPTYTTGAGASYTVIVTSNATGCRDTSDPVAVTVNPLITATQQLNICANQLPYTWNGQTVASGGTAVATYTTPSLVTGCDSTTTLNLSINAVITATQTLNICASQLPYTWNGQTVSTGGTAVATYTTSSLVSTCDSTTTLNLSVTQPPTATATPASQNICSGATTAIALSAASTGTTYSWTAGQTGVTGAAAGSGNSIAQTLTSSGTTPGTVTYAVTPSLNGCPGAILNVTVNVAPAITLTATPAAPSICSGSATAIALSTGQTGSSYTWTVSQTGVTGATAGTGSNIAQTLTNSGTTSGTATYTVTPTVNSCPGAPAQVTVTVHPKPAATITPSATTICSGGTTNIALTANVSGSSFAWTVSQNNVSGATAGNGSTIAQTLTATAATAGTATYTITPTANGCPGTTGTATVTVNPAPAAPGAISGLAEPCAGSNQVYSVAAVTGATSYTWTLPPGWTGSSTTNSITVGMGTTSGVLQVQAVNSCGSSPASTRTINVIPVVTPSVAIASNAPALLCSGIAVTFTATAGNGGSSPAYQWKVNGNNNGTNSNTFTYIPSDGDTITCSLQSNAPCVSAATVTSNRLIMSVTPSVTPALNIYVVENHTCSDTPVSFLATPTHGGLNPGFQWKRNGLNTGTNSNTFSYLPANGDVITCVLTSNATCASPVSVVSNPVPMTIVTVTTPSVSISVNPGAQVQSGQAVTFTAAPAQAGSSYQVTWYRNGDFIAGASGNSWTAIAGTDFFNANEIKARLQSFSPCALPDTAWSNGITMSIGTTGIGSHAPPENFRLYPNPGRELIYMEGLEPGDTWQLYDAAGRSLLQERVSSSGTRQADVSGLAQGMYWMRFTTPKGRQWLVKIAKQ